MTAFLAPRTDLVQALIRAAQDKSGLLVEVQDQVIVTGAGSDATAAAHCPALVTSPGAIVLPPVTVTLARLLTGPTAELTVTGSRAILRSGRLEYTLPVLPADDFPRWRPGPEPVMRTDAALLAAVIRKVAPLAGEFGAGAQLAQLSAGDDLTVVCTDGYSIGIGHLPADAVLPGECLLRDQVLERLARVLGEGPCAVGWDEELAVFAVPGLTVTCRQVAGNFPDWRKLTVSVPPASIIIPVPPLTVPLRAAVLAAGQDGAATVALASGELTVAAEGEGGRISDRLAVSYAGEPVTFHVGAARFLDGLSRCGQEATLAFSTPLAPLYLSGEGYSCIIAPRREI